MSKSLPEHLLVTIHSLSPRERAQLLRTLLSGSQGSRHPLSSGVSGAVEQLLWRLANKPAPPYQIHARGRLWLIFMLLRYAGIRLSEIFRLRDQDCAFQAGMIYCQNRKIPLPENAARKLAGFWSKWPGRAASPFPLACDSSQVRRGFANCAKLCGIEPGMLNASALRRQRALELEANGMPQTLAAWLLGRRRDPAPFSMVEAQAIINQQIKQENRMKTSARNVFNGEIAKIEEHGILVNVLLKTPGGLQISSIITRTSKDSLRLEPGMPAAALIKAPWVTVLTENERASAGIENTYQGTVKKITRDELACEIHIELPQGIQICSLYANGASPSEGIHENSEVLVTFSPFSVILTAD